MRQVLQNLHSGETLVEDVPAPICRPGHVRIASSVSLISAGTERMLVDFARGSLLAKARQQPEKVSQALQKVRSDGLLPTIEAVRSKLDLPLALGYCNVGRVIEIGVGVEGLKPGDRVVSNAKHAEIAVVPHRLCVPVPDHVDDESAVFAVPGAIALQGVRLAAPTVGECFAVTGLGLIGLLTAQILRANGCRVLGIDMDRERIALAQRFGVETVDIGAGEDAVARAAVFSRGRGMDGVLLAASTTSNDPISAAARMCRKRGRIVLIGVTGLNLKRSEFYEKELSFQVSCSYGPGRYDTAYEEQGHDYPIGLVRWTEQRNFEAVLDMMADRTIDVKPLISHRFPIERAPDAYAALTGSGGSLGIVLEYPGSEVPPETTLRLERVRPTMLPSRHESEVSVSFLGSGNYATRSLMPAFKAAGARLLSAACSGGVSGVYAGRKHGFEKVTTDVKAVLDDMQVDAIVIATRHDTHAQFAIEALQAGKHVFVEKPLCLTLDELESIEAAYRGLSEPRLLMVGFNRRFSPHIRKMKELLAPVNEPKSFIMTINAGAIPKDHWSQDAAGGGGRIIGEGCHFIDLVRHLAGCPIDEYSCAGFEAPNRDTASLQLVFADGSIGTVHYFANGNRRFPKERLEVFCSGRILQLDNFRILRGFGWPRFSKLRLLRQDKGQRGCAAAFMHAIRDGGAAPIAFEEILEVSRVTLGLARP